MSENTLTAQQARDRLYDIIKQDVSFDEKARDALEVGRQYLGVDNGHLTRIDAATNYWQAAVSTDPPDGQFPPGLELDLDTTYCRRVIGGESSVALHDATEQGWADDPAFRAHGLHYYHGTEIRLDDEPYGTVCFVAEDPRREPISEAKTLFAELLTRLLEQELAQEQHQMELTRQRNLNNVLNRVLRHNLRNDLSVIRGYTQSLSDIDPAGRTEAIIRRTDKLLDLSQKARDLEYIIGSDFDRHERDIVALIEDVTRRVESSFPRASIEIHHDDPVSATVMPSLAEAFEELIENAAKHGGETPGVQVSIRNVPTAFEVTIVDDGPGLSDQERRVIDSGIETPLYHGSGLGLWTAYWIVTSHDGTIQVSAPAEGTSITITVPRTAATGVHEQVTELARARDQYQAAFEEGLDAMVIIDDEARIMDANAEAARIYGVERKNLLGRSVNEFLPAGFDFGVAWEEFRTTGTVRDTVTIVGEGGIERPVEYSATADIVPGLHLVISRDITDRTRQEQELRRQTRAMDKAPVGITISDPDEDNALVYANERFLELTGYPEEEVLGRNCRFLQGEGTKPEPVREIRQAIDDEEPVTVTLRNHRRDGTEFWNRLNIAPVYDDDGTLRNYVGFQQDVTDRMDT